MKQNKPRYYIHNVVHTAPSAAYRCIKYTASKLTLKLNLTLTVYFTLDPNPNCFPKHHNLYDL